MTIDLDHLEAAAKAATPGPWRYDNRRKEIWSSDTPIIEACYYARRNVDYIVAVSPDVVLELVAELRKRDKAMKRLARALRVKNRALAIAQRECKYAQERAAQKEEKQ